LVQNDCIQFFAFLIHASHVLNTIPTRNNQSYGTDLGNSPGERKKSASGKFALLYCHMMICSTAQGSTAIPTFYRNPFYKRQPAEMHMQMSRQHHAFSPKRKEADSRKPI
jgi:hypothetical protein